MIAVLQPKRKHLTGPVQNSFLFISAAIMGLPVWFNFQLCNNMGSPARGKDCFDFKASGVFVGQKLSKAKNTLALCSRWSHRGIQKSDK